MIERTEKATQKSTQSRKAKSQRLVINTQTQKHPHKQNNHQREIENKHKEPPSNLASR
jgi:hypothetical protein